MLRFKVRKRNIHAFDEVNLKLMNGDMPLTAKEEETFVREMINSPDLYQYTESTRTNMRHLSLFHICLELLIMAYRSAMKKRS